MKLKEFINKLRNYDQEAEVLVACDEELNTLFKDVQVATYDVDDVEKKYVVIWGNSGSEMEDD